MLNLLDSYLDSQPGLKLIEKWNLKPYSENSVKCEYVLEALFYFNAWMNAGAGSKTVPSTDGSSSDGGLMDSPLHFVVLLFITSFVSIFIGF